MSVVAIVIVVLLVAAVAVAVWQTRSYRRAQRRVDNTAYIDSSRSRRR